MKQVAQNYRSGALDVIDAPPPSCAPGGVLVRSLYSLISTGTELMKVGESKLSLVGKARARPDQVKKVLENVQQQGALMTYKKAMNRLDSFSPLGYSLAGIVQEVGKGAEEFTVGQLVACAGNEFALHAEVNWVPTNLCVAVPDGVTPQLAAFATVGSIVLQGVRQGNVQLGETACVIGLGLVGQLVVQLLLASGVQVVGLDPDPERCRLAEKAGAILCAAPDEDGSTAVEQALSKASGGIGADRVFLVAGGSSNQPVELAARLARDRATIVDIGKCKLDLPWNDYYEKELELRFSRSYGPGRYDPKYELDGVDYPVGYVRWTERRNLDCFVNAVARKEIDPEPLISGVFPLGDAPDVYEKLSSGALRGVGFLFEYDVPEEDDREGPTHKETTISTLSGRTTASRSVRRSREGYWDGTLGVGFVGAGNYASSMLLPHLMKEPGIALARVATRSSLSAVNAQRKFKFGSAGTDAEAILGDPRIEAVFIVTRHSSHADLTCRALEAGKAVFVEKPLALSTDELARILATVDETGNDRLMVGFNRRFSPLLVEMRTQFGRSSEPTNARYMVNAGRLGTDSWYRDNEVEGSRFVGEGGHFVDTMSWWIGSDPVEVLTMPAGGSDEVQVSLRFEDGSLATITYLTSMHRRFPKETFEVSSGGRTARFGQFQADDPLGWFARTSPSAHRTSRQRSGRPNQSIRATPCVPVRQCLSHWNRWWPLLEPRWLLRSRPAPAACCSGYDARLFAPEERRHPRPVKSAEMEWRLRRLSKMSPSEVRWRISDHVRRKRWASQQVLPEYSPQPGVLSSSAQRQGLRHQARTATFRGLASGDALDTVPHDARQGVIDAADEILAGRWQVLGILRRDMVDPDWFYDPVTGTRAPQNDYCFRVNHRSEDVTGNVKQIWELSRMHHLTVLAAAFCISGEERYATRAASHLRSWWAQNPFLSGVHWTSGIEAGVRLISWVWVRRLLDGWAGAVDLFERNEVARAQIWWHQNYLASFRSRGSSANNHVIAEAAGLLVGALAFDWFAESPRWVEEATRVLEDELRSNTFPSGVNREMAFDYHGFVAELTMVAAAEASWAGRPLSQSLWSDLYRMFDVVATTVDAKVRAPRYGDGDNGRGLVIDPPVPERSSGLLAIGEAVFDGPDWWPKVSPTVMSTLLESMTGRRPGMGSTRNTGHYDDAGLTLLRSAPSDGEEIWCRCDGGPHGFLSIAAHAHADALSVEVRYNGVDVLADPGTYCYHGEPRWRSYFRSTLAHNTVELGGCDQSTPGGPFLWQRQAQSKLIELETAKNGEPVAWSAEHDGYQSLTPPVCHLRSVRLASRLRQLEIVDRVETKGRHPLRVAFHLGPEIDAQIVGQNAELVWSDDGATKTGTLQLPDSLSWSLYKGETDPVLGWYSPSFGSKQPAWTLIGDGTCSGTGLDTYTTVLQFHA